MAGGTAFPPARLAGPKPETKETDVSTTINQTTPGDEGSPLTTEQVRAACKAFEGALDVAQGILAAYRDMIKRFEASGTFTVDAETRATLDALEADDGAFVTLDRLDALRRGEQP